MSDLSSFAALGLSPVLLEALAKKGFEEPTPIQALVIPALLQGDCDIIGQAQTGTGKTAAFALPLIERLEPGSPDVQALVLTPTRELAMQVSEEISSLRGGKPFSVTPVYGGQSYGEQLRRFRQGVDILVGTPGRILDHLERGTLSFAKVKYLILDEADEMLDMGFQDEIEALLAQVNRERRTLLFSATMPDRIRQIASKYMKNPKHLAVKATQLTVELTEQIYFEVTEADKFEALCRILDLEEDFYGMVFCRTKIQTDELARRLADRGYGSDALHGDLSQPQRESILRKFKNKKTNILCATDVAARGLDVEGLTHVINHGLPQDPEAYVHRIGRTGRAGREGTAVTFITPVEYRKLAYIERVSKARIRKGRVPGVGEIIALKKARITAGIAEALEQPTLKVVQDLAAELLEGKEPAAVLSAVLQQYAADELDEAAYAPIRDLFDRAAPKPTRTDRPPERFDRQPRQDRSYERPGGYERPERGQPFRRDSSGPGGKARLFIAKGRRDGLSPKRLVDFLEQEGGVPSRFIDDAIVMEDFSFATVSFRDAEALINVFRSHGTEGRPLVKLARPEEGGGGGGGAPGGGGGAPFDTERKRKFHSPGKFEKPQGAPPARRVKKD